MILKFKICIESSRGIKKRKWVRIAAIVVAFVMCAAAVNAQQPQKVPRIGYLSSLDRVNDAARTEPFRQALRDLGYIEGQNIVIEYRYRQGKSDRYAEFAAELVRLKVDLIVVASGDPWIRAAKNATPTIPIVMMGGGVDPVEAGLIKSLSRPGGNVTGLTNLSRKLGGKRLELLKEAVPKVSRVAVLYDPGSGSERAVKETLPFAARALSLTVRPWIVRKAADFDSVFTEMSKERPDGLYVPARGPLITKNEQKIANFALGNRFPSAYSYGAGVEAGGLLYYGPDLTDLYQRVAIYVDRIIKGTKPADLPVEQPTKFELIINLRTAQQIGLAIPPNILARADRVIR